MKHMSGTKSDTRKRKCNEKRFMCIRGLLFVYEMQPGNNSRNSKLSALDPPFIQPLSFYPSVTQHLSALAALDPPFIQPLSFYPPVTQHLSALDPPFITPLSNLCTSTHPSPSTYQPLIHVIQPFIQPLSNLYPIFILLPTRQPLIHPLSNVY